MKTEHSQDLKASRHAGMWSTVSLAIQSGWRTTGQLLAILAMRGIVLIGTILALRDSHLATAFQAILPGVP